MSLRSLFHRDKTHPNANTWGIKLERNDGGRGNQYRFVYVAYDDKGERTETILRPASNPLDTEEFWS